MPAASGSAFTRIHGTSAQNRRAKIERREQGGSSRFRATKRIPRARIWKARSRATGEFQRVSSAKTRKSMNRNIDFQSVRPAVLQPAESPAELARARL